MGEDLRVLLFAVTEGGDKPLKYPTLINTADVVVASKMDIAEAVGFDCDLALRNIQLARPGAEVIQRSARTGEGIEAWLEYLRKRLEQKRNAAAAVAEAQIPELAEELCAGMSRPRSESCCNPN